MSNAKFRTDFAKLLKKAGDNADTVVRHTALTLQSEMVARSPVATGRFKGNWQAGIKSINTDTSTADDKSGSAAIGRTRATLSWWRAGMTINLTNSLPYARVLEYGRANGNPGSLQAPQGVVRLTLQNFRQSLAKALKGLA